MHILKDFKSFKNVSADSKEVICVLELSADSEGVSEIAASEARFGAELRRQNGEDAQGRMALGGSPEGRSARELDMDMGLLPLEDSLAREATGPLCVLCALWRTRPDTALPSTRGQFSVVRELCLPVLPTLLVVENPA